MSKQDSHQSDFPRKFGKYHLLAPLAQGGMGALYLAVTGERGFERLLVIKTVLPHLADAEYIARFRDEAKVVVKLSHGNLIPVFDAGQVDGELFMAMDFVEGKDLRAVWNQCAKKGIAFPVDVAVFIVKELCRGLGYAHSFGGIDLVHRDISPPNVLMSYAGEVKLTDFGLASSTLKLEKTAPGIIYGKVAYMSPEQARGDKLDGRSDLYAAGIILWELLTGRQLFPPSPDQPQDLVTRASDPEVQRPSERASRVPRELDEICAKALAPRVEDRYATGEEFRDALGNWLASEAPGTDAATVEQFLRRLFADEIKTERAERQALIEKTRERIKTLPPTHELRQMLDGEGGPRFGRRASDRGADRRGRRENDRPPVGRTSVGMAVDVPPPGPGGRTVVRQAETGTGAALATHDEAEPEMVDDAETDVVGSILDGRYRIVELIGEGGMGRVYLAEHVEIGKRVAVKVLHQVYSRMPDLVERFRREARAASKIGHPHIVDVTDSGRTADGSVYFVMEYLEGVELANVIDREGALDINRALRIVTQICRALSAAHQVGIIHRDLKPENVYLTVREGSSDFVKVLDFGIAKSTEAEEARDKRLTHPGMAMGTPEYMAPEQAAGKPADQRCDVYAVGAILYEMLTGVPPYSGDNFMEILTKKATVDPEPPQTLRAEIPDIVNDLVMQAMARSADDRPPSMEALEYELTKCLSGRGAAVAKILGMRGFTGRGEPLADRPKRGSEPPRSERSARPSTAADDVALAPTESISSRAVRADTAPPPASGFAQPRLEDTQEAVPDVRSQTLGLLGWGLLGGAIAAAAAVVLFVASGEKSAPAIRTEPFASPAPQTSPKRADVVEDEPDGDRDKATRSKRPKPTPVKPKDRGKDELAKTGAPTTQADAEAILVAAEKAEKDLDWKQARLLYGRLSQANRKDLRARGYDGIARASFELKNLERAIEAAEQALREGAGISARRVLANAHFRKGDYDTAIKHYELLLKQRPKDREARQLLEEAKKKRGSK